MRSKDFKSEFYYILDMFKSRTNFSYSRFSDGELYQLQNKNITLSSEQVMVSGVIDTKGPGHPEYDHKYFDVTIGSHREFRDYLVASFLHDQDGYYKGISCPCCVGDVDFNWQLNSLGGDSDNITWSNLFLNSNYPLFMSEFYPEIQKRGAYVICNKAADLSKLDWVKGSFYIGNDIFDNFKQYVSDIKAYIINNNLQDQVFLFSASSLSNILQHSLYKIKPDNTYIDIGTTLSYEFNIPSIRGYIEQYRNGTTGSLKTCRWK